MASHDLEVRFPSISQINRFDVDVSSEPGSFFSMVGRESHISDHPIQNTQQSLRLNVRQRRARESLLFAYCGFALCGLLAGSSFFCLRLGTRLSHPYVHCTSLVAATILGLSIPNFVPLIIDLSNWTQNKSKCVFLMCLYVLFTITGMVLSAGEVLFPDFHDGVDHTHDQLQEFYSIGFCALGGFLFSLSIFATRALPVNEISPTSTTIIRMSSLGIAGVIACSTIIFSDVTHIEGISERHFQSALDICWTIVSFIGGGCLVCASVWLVSKLTQSLHKGHSSLILTIISLAAAVCALISSPFLSVGCASWMKYLGVCTLFLGSLIPAVVISSLWIKREKIERNERLLAREENNNHFSVVSENYVDESNFNSQIISDGHNNSLNLHQHTSDNEIQRHHGFRANLDISLSSNALQTSIINSRFSQEQFKTQAECSLLEVGGRRDLSISKSKNNFENCSEKINKPILCTNNTDNRPQNVLDKHIQPQFRSPQTSATEEHQSVYGNSHYPNRRFGRLAHFKNIFFAFLANRSSSHNRHRASRRTFSSSLTNSNHNGIRTARRFYSTDSTSRHSNGDEQPNSAVLSQQFSEFTTSRRQRKQIRRAAKQNRKKLKWNQFLSQGGGDHNKSAVGFQNNTKFNNLMNFPMHRRRHQHQSYNREEFAKTERILHFSTKKMAENHDHIHYRIKNNLNQSKGCGNRRNSLLKHTNSFLQNESPSQKGFIDNNEESTSNKTAYDNIDSYINKTQSKIQNNDLYDDSSPTLRANAVHNQSLINSFISSTHTLNKDIIGERHFVSKEFNHSTASTSLSHSLHTPNISSQYLCHSISLSNGSSPLVNTCKTLSVNQPSWNEHLPGETAGDLENCDKASLKLADFDENGASCTILSPHKQCASTQMGKANIADKNITSNFAGLKDALLVPFQQPTEAFKFNSEDGKKLKFASIEPMPFFKDESHISEQTATSPLEFQLEKAKRSLKISSIYNGCNNHNYNDNANASSSSPLLPQTTLPAAASSLVRLKHSRNPFASTYANSSLLHHQHQIAITTNSSLNNDQHLHHSITPVAAALNDQGMSSLIASPLQKVKHMSPQSSPHAHINCCKYSCSIMPSPVSSLSSFGPQRSLSASATTMNLLLLPSSPSSPSNVYNSTTVVGKNKFNFSHEGKQTNGRKLSKYNNNIDNIQLNVERKHSNNNNSSKTASGLMKQMIHEQQQSKPPLNNTRHESHDSLTGDDLRLSFAFAD